MLGNVETAKGFHCRRHDHGRKRNSHPGIIAMETTRYRATQKNIIFLSGDTTMKKAILMALLPVLIFACKKEVEKKPDLAKKYAKYGIAVYEDQTMKKWMANLAKAEGVEFDPAAVIVQPGGEDIAEVMLSDGKTGYLQLKHLADTPIVFIEDTKAHERNNPASRVFTTLPKGTIGFMIDEKGEWVQIYAGKIADRWVTRQWVRGGYSTDENLLIDAKLYEEATAALAKSGAKDAEKKEAKKKLEDLVKSSTIFSDLSSKKLEEFGDRENPDTSEVSTETKEESISN